MSYEHSSPSGAATPIRSGKASISNGKNGVNDSQYIYQNGRTFSTRVMHPRDLLKEEDLLDELMTLVNDAYRGTHTKLEAQLGVDKHSIFDQVRLRSKTQLVEELSSDSYLALMFDETKEIEEHASESELGQNKVQSGPSQQRLVAVASLKRWKGTVTQRHWRAVRASGQRLPPADSQYHTENDTSLDPDPSNFWDWEIATCSSADEPKYRGMGLISQLNALLLDRLKLKRDVESESSKLPIRLWVSALGGTINKDYWKKRGYTVQGDVDLAPPPIWGNRQDVEIWTLNKIIG